MRSSAFGAGISFKAIGFGWGIDCSGVNWTKVAITGCCILLLVNVKGGGIEGLK